MSKVSKQSKPQEDWKKAEQIVCKLTGGKRTPGSGNKRIQGDVRINCSTGMVEVKQTSKTYIDLKKEWLDSLEQYSLEMDVILAIFFELRGYIYLYYGKTKTPEKWSSKRIHEKELPKFIHTSKSLWKLEDLSDLRSFKS